jgi:hypothetical protein
VVWWDLADKSVKMRASPDGGATWGEATRLSGGGWGGPLVESPTNGTLARALLPTGSRTIQVVRAANGSVTTFPIADAGGQTLIFPVAAYDAAGALYVAWSSGDVPSVKLARSLDDGVTWSAPQAISTPGHAALLPAIVAGAAGRLALAWYEARVADLGPGSPNLWDVRLAESTDADATAPAWAHATLTTTPAHVGAVCTSGAGCAPGASDRTLGDLLEIRLLRGLPIVAYATDGPARSESAQVYVGRVGAGTNLEG